MPSSSVQTQRYRILKKNISIIDKHFLPKQINVTGMYTNLQENKLRGYRLLVHAELESYFEDIAKEIAITAYKRWCSNGEVGLTLTSICAYTSGHPDPPISCTDRNHPELNERVKDATDTYVSQITVNNGIKQKDLLRMLLPIGIQIKDLDPTWLNDMDAYGKARGDTAHKSIKVQAPIDPLTEKKLVERIVKVIGNLDTLFKSNFGVK